MVRWLSQSRSQATASITLLWYLSRFVSVFLVVHPRFSAPFLPNYARSVLRLLAALVLITTCVSTATMGPLLRHLRPERLQVPEQLGWWCEQEMPRSWTGLPAVLCLVQMAASPTADLQ